MAQALLLLAPILDSTCHVGTHLDTCSRLRRRRDRDIGIKPAAVSLHVNYKMGEHLLTPDVLSLDREEMRPRRHPR